MLKQFKISVWLKKKAALAFIFFALLMIIGCGKRKPPQPPVERVSQRVEISGFQRGGVVDIKLTLPFINAADGSVLNINRVDIYRLAESLDTNLSLTEDEFASRSTLIASLPVSKEDFNSKQFTYIDTLDFAGQPSRLRYAVRFVNSSGQKAAFSNFLLIEPTAKIASAPSNLSAVIREEAIKLSWNPPDSNVDGSKPANIIGYKIYRSDAAEVLKPLNSTPFGENVFFDKNYDFGIEYKYLVRTVSLSGSGEPLESLDSNTIKVMPIDIFAPSAPGSVTIGAAPNNLSIFFAANPEKDIAGYRIYRTTDSSRPKAEWTLLTEKLLTTNTFQDSRVESGKTYFYYILAVDKAGNVSVPSETFSETAP